MDEVQSDGTSQEQQDELKRKVEEQLKEISDGDQNHQALINLASMVATLYKSLIVEGLDEEIALRLSGCYIEAVIATMMGN